MTMPMTMEDFRDQLLKYISVEKKFDEEENERQKQMSIEEKVDKNILLTGITVSNQDGDVYELDVPNNYSKLRAGDKVIITETKSGTEYEATVIDVFFDTITVSCEKQLNAAASFTMEQKSPELLQSLIACLEGLYAGIPGAAFLRLLSGEEQFEKDDFLKVSIEDVPCFNNIRSKLNEGQLNAVISMLEYPPVHVLQGPPGTGKTLVLAATAIATARKNREVVVIANTHHAVNNALQKIRSLDKDVTIIKVGSSLKAEELDKSVMKFEKFSEYYEYSYNNRRKKKSGHIIGMTIWSAITNLGLRHHVHFRPYQALVDEASLMPLSLASILGKTAPSVCLFGDSRQMPPIFRPELKDNICSISVLDYCANNIPGVPVSVLKTTYRMNQDITECVSRNFYEPNGIRLTSAECSKYGHLSLVVPEGTDERIRDILGTERSIHTLNATIDESCQDNNPEEASFAAQLVSSAMKSGLRPEDIAVITPFRKQVNAIRSALRSLNYEPDELPLVDTVERLQGQDVRMIIISFAVSDKIFYNSIKDFLLNPNRLNVMISRAKEKVVLLKSNAIEIIL